MLKFMLSRAQAGRPNIVAVESSAVDLQYPKDSGDNALKREFFSQLKELLSSTGGAVLFDENPRGGDMCLVPAEDFDSALIAFGEDQHLFDGLANIMTRKALARSLREIIFGVPHAVAGGSLANTFHALVTAQVDGQQLVEGHFLTAVGDDHTGLTFIESMNGHIHAARGGRQMECHVFPIESDRILITTPGKTSPAEAFITKDLFDNNRLHRRDRIMLGGFLFFAPGFHDVYDHVLDHLRSLPENDRPTMVLTAASQSVAGHPDFRRKITEAVTLTKTVIHANTDEFRRLLDMDTDWRKSFEADFAGLKGQALEAAKDAHAAYKQAKDKANHDAIDEAGRQARALNLKTGHTLQYVVTNGRREIFVIGPRGCETYTPNKIDKSRIVNTVGAGDNFAAGFQLGSIFGFSNALSVKMAADFATAVIQIPGARLDSKMEQSVTLAGTAHTVKGSLAALQPHNFETFVRTLGPAGPTLR